MRFYWNFGCVLLAAAALSLGLSSRASAQQDGYPAQQNAEAPRINPARRAGYTAGFRAGAADHQQNTPYDFRRQAAYRQAERRFPNSGVDRETYILNYRTGYEDGYDDGYYGRHDDPGAVWQRNYAPPPPSPPPGPRVDAQHGVLPVGTALDLRLNNTLSTRSSEPGDSFTATVVEPVYNERRRRVLVPAGSTVEGRVVAVDSSSDLSGESRLQLRFERLRLPDGTSFPLRAELSQVYPDQGAGAAITGSPTVNDEGGVEQSQTRTTVGTAAAAGAVGALIGAIAGGGKGAGIGGLLGAGLGVALASHKGALDLPAGTPITIRLNRPIDLRG